ncbi:DUF1211 domain-containing protein [Oenococcus sp. UCMA 14587]|nr:DUF1211 domain-containing protein [Oenococcus sp. UCMA 14587]
MIKGEDLRRIINFSDAIVAVAITLLVIPLTDIFQKVPQRNLINILSSASFYLKFSGFLISFFVIYSFWENHHKTFSAVTQINNTVARLNKFWLLSIVLIPATTMINMSEQNNIGIYIYGIVLIINLLLLQKIKTILRPGYKIYSSSILIMLLLCMIIITIFPKFGQTVYYLLLLGRPIKYFFPKIFTDY